MGGCLYAEIKCHNGCGEAVPRRVILLHEMEVCSLKQNDQTELEKLLYFYVQELMHDIMHKDKRTADAESESKKEVHPVVLAPDESATQNVIPEARELMTSKKEVCPIIPAHCIS